jgi:hypothetical protein
MGCGHLPKFGLHRDAVAADTPGSMPPGSPLFNCRGYETVLVQITTDGVGGTADVEIYVADDASTPVGYLIDSAAAVADGSVIELKAFGAQIFVNVSGYGGSATVCTVKIAGAVPERALGG